MKIEASDTPGKILIDCLECGAMFPVMSMSPPVAAHNAR